MPALFIGLMSGTSMDGVDAALCRFDNQRFTGITARHTAAYPADLRTRLLRLQREAPALSLREYCELDNAVARVFANTTLGLLGNAKTAPANISAVGSHGQTVFHDPVDVASSIQLGNPSLIAASTGITVVADFRRADVAHGGQGAPLVPAFHHALFADRHEARCILNLGGIANITILPNGDAQQVRGLDTGPGNGLMDEWVERHLHLPFDRHGAWARSGTLHADLLEALMKDDYFQRQPPKSTGRSDFNLAWVARRYPGLWELPPADVQRSFCELTAVSVAHAIQRWAPAAHRLLLCGGGARNEFLCERLKQLLPGMRLDQTDQHGLGAADVESAAFAWLAMRTINGLPGNLPAATGASRPAILGGIYRA